MRYLILLLVGLTFPVVIGAQTVDVTERQLGQVKRIYVDDEPYETPVEKAVKPLLQAELTKQGFVVVNAKNDADAILSGEATITITIHPTRDSLPDRASYRYRLLSVGNKVLWKGTVKFVSKGGWATNNSVGAAKIVSKLTKAWQESQRK